MKRLFLAVVVIIAGCSSNGHTATAPTTHRPVTTTTSTRPPTVCHYGPSNTRDPACTPGALNSAVTQRTIGTTICVPGWTATVRPPTSVTGPIKRERMHAYGDTLPASAYELDHLIPLELGGAPVDIRNLWPEPYPSASVKDTLENSLKRQVCAGTVTLALARQRVVQ